MWPRMEMLIEAATMWPPCDHEVTAMRLQARRCADHAHRKLQAGKP